jgi:hypothetical protein
MKINKKALELIEKGLSSTTVSKLDESQISILHKRLFLGEQVEEIPAKKSYKVGQDGGNLPAAPKGYNVKKTATGDVVATPNESELEEDVEVTTDPNKETETQDPQQVGPSSDDGFGDETDGMGMFESEADLKPGQPNPWAICHAQVGPKRTRKFERCVQSVKDQLKEGKNPVSLFIENQIMKIVEKNLPPRITKGDLIRHLSEGENFATKHLQSFGKSSGTETAPAKPKTSPTTKPGTKPSKPSHPGKNPNPGEQPAPKAKAKKEVEENGPAVAPSKPKTSPTTKPGTKPGTKPQRPAHPGKNPNPGENPAPKAKTPSAEETKDKVIDVILNLLQK